MKNFKNLLLFETEILRHSLSNSYIHWFGDKKKKLTISGGLPWGVSSLTGALAMSVGRDIIFLKLLVSSESYLLKVVHRLSRKRKQALFNSDGLVLPTDPYHHISLWFVFWILWNSLKFHVILFVHLFAISSSTGYWPRCFKTTINPVSLNLSIK